MPENPIKVEDLIAVLHPYDGRSRYVLFLGAGASVESGLPGASWIVLDLLRRSYAAHHKLSDANHVPESEIHHWAGKQAWFQADSNVSEYAKVMRNTRRTPGAQWDYLRPLLEAARPSLGYHYLGALVKEGIFQTIVTTNFDHLVRLGCDRVLDVPINEMQAEQWLVAQDPAPTERRLLRLHGDLNHYNLLNTGPQLDATPPPRFEALRQLLRSHGLIVLGYGGNDVKLMHEAFLKLWEDPNLAMRGVYWCLLPGESPSLLASDFVEKAPTDRAFFVEIQGFDETMKRIADSFGCSLPREAQYRMQYESLSKEHALLLRHVEEWGTGGVLNPQLRLQFLQQIANLLRLARAVLLFVGADGSFAVEATPRPEVEDPSRVLSEVLRRDLAGRLQYKLWPPGDQTGEDPLWKLFPPNHEVEAFPVWDGDKLKGALVVASEKTPVAETEQARLVAAMAQLLLRT